MPDADCLDIDEATAKAKADGSCLITMTTEVELDGGSDLYSKPLKSSRQVFVNVTVGQVWDGSTATSCATGNGTAEDPFIIKNGAQLAYAVRNNRVSSMSRFAISRSTNPTSVQTIPN